MASTSGTADGKADKPEENDSSGEILPGFASIGDFSQQALRAMLQATKASNDLPTGDDYDFYSTFDNVRNVLDIEARRILQLIQRLLRHQSVKGTVTGVDQAMELDEQFDVLIDGNDQILEKVGTWIDEAVGVRKNENKLVVAAATKHTPPSAASWNKKKSTGNTTSTPLRLLTAKNIQRPQLSFKDKVDNSNRPFFPIIKDKPNALKSLEESFRLPENITLEDTEKPDFMYPHPYQHEIDVWQVPPSQLEKTDPQETGPVDDHPPQFIDTIADLMELCDVLKREKEIAVDLEHHSYRTFQGFVCLMQISTRQKDYLVDTLALRADMHILNQVFTDPNIVKVFHGADSDIEWLQRDFGIYVVNMFDTGQAARVLNLARFSLAHLLHLYCRVEANKQFQLADWRIRPLPDELVRYAQEDTHYLLYIYDVMRNELITRGNEQKNLLQSVYQRSKMVCLKVYKKTILTEDSHLDLYLKSKKVFNSQQMQALKDLYAWRDKMARTEDESVQYVLPNHMLLQMAEILPRERQGVLACCNPIPPIVRQYQFEIHSIIMAARETPLVQMEQKRTLEPSAAQHPHYHTEPLLACPHDLSHPRNLSDDQMDVSETVSVTSTSSLFKSPSSDIKLLDTPCLSALATSGKSCGTRWSKKVAEEIRSSFSSPFLKFLPDKERPASILAPSKLTTTVKGEVTWRLKQNTTASSKRKSDVDLDSFEPEFVPPVKSARADVKLNLSTTKKPPSSVTDTPVTTEVPSTPTQQPAAGKEKEEEETPVSLRQQKKKKKKEKKQKDASATPTPAQDKTPQNTVTLLGEKEEKKKKKKKKLKNGTSDTSAVPATPEAETVEKKKKKKKKKLAEEASEIPEEAITPFDYSKADKSGLTGETTKKIHKDVYNPNFQGSKKNKGKKKNRFGGQQRRSVTYGSGTAAKK